MSVITIITCKRPLLNAIPRRMENTDMKKRQQLQHFFAFCLARCKILFGSMLSHRSFRHSLRKASFESNANDITRLTQSWRRAVALKQGSDYRGHLARECLLANKTNALEPKSDGHATMRRGTESRRTHAALGGRAQAHLPQQPSRHYSFTIMGF